MPYIKTPRWWCEICGNPVRASQYGVCAKTPECQRERIRRRDRAMRDRQLAWRQARPGFVRDWYEAADRDGFYREWVAAWPAGLHAAVNKESARRGLSLRPALARLDTSTREPLYGMSGSGFSLGAALCPDGLPGIMRKSLTHAEGDVLGQAVAAGRQDGVALLRLDHDPCANCVGSFGGYGRLLGVAALFVYGSSGLVGVYSELDGKFRARGSHWWAGFARGADREARARARRQARAAMAAAEAAA